MSEEMQKDTLAQLRDEFSRRGLLGETLRIENGGKLFSVRCDDRCFTVYRINQQNHLPPGLPGWSVCRLEEGGCFSLDQAEKVCPPLASGQEWEQVLVWVNMVLGHLDSLA